MIIQIRNIIRLGHLDTGFRLVIINMPIRIIGKIPEFQCQFIMVIALRIIICRNILSKHKTVFNITVPQTLFINRAVIGIHLNISSIRHAVLRQIFVSRLLAIAGVVEHLISIRILPFILILMYPLHILIKEKCPLRFGMKLFFIAVTVRIIRTSLRHSRSITLVKNSLRTIFNRVALMNQIAFIFRLIVSLTFHSASIIHRRHPQ